MKKIFLTVAVCAVVVPAALTAKVRKDPFGKAPDGAVEIYTIANRAGAEARIITYGGILVSLKVPDRKGAFGDVVLGFDSLAGYLGTHPYFGALIGRYGNRIGGAQFSLNGKLFTLKKNNGENSLHGGEKGFDKRIWKVTGTGGSSVTLSYVSRDGEEGFPGQLTSLVTYSITESNELRIHYVARTTKDTVVNLTNHAYFNLAGAGNGDILKHDVMIAADQYNPVDAGLIPTGQLAPVAGTPFDFTKPMAIGARIEQNNEQIRLGGGYDHNFVLRKATERLPKVAEVYESGTGRVMEVLTSEPGLQFYTGNFLDGTIIGKGGKPYGKRAAFCMETQHFPDSPNKPSFPSVVLKPGKRYETTTVYRFSSR